jgi:hypothetical protein
MLPGCKTVQQILALLEDPALLLALLEFKNQPYNDDRHQHGGNEHYQAETLFVFKL